VGGERPANTLINIFFIIEGEEEKKKKNRILNVRTMKHVELN